MAGFSDRIRVLIDVVTDGANTGLANFRSKLSEAETTGERFKAGMSGAFEMVKQNAGALALSAGAAFAALGAQAVQEFTRTAIEAERFSNSTGMSIENSSRWLEVMSRWGVELGDLQDVFNNVSGQIAAGDPIFAQLGITIQTTADGTTDMNATMLELVRTVASIKDPAEQAAAAAKFFGEEGARQFSELIAKGADVEQIFAAVSDSQIIDRAELDKAKRMEETMRDINRAWQDGKLILGEFVLDVVNGFRGMLEGAEDFGHSIRSLWDDAAAANYEVADAFDASEDAARRFDRSLLAGLTTFEAVRAKVLELTGDQHAANVVALEWNETTGAQIRLQQEQVASLMDVRMQTDGLRDDMTDAERATALKAAADRVAAQRAQQHADAVAALERRYASLKDELNDRSAYLGLGDAFDSVETAAVAAWDAAESGAADADAQARAHEQSIIDLKNKVIDYGSEIEGLPPQRVTEILALIDGGQYAEAERLLALLERERIINLRIESGQITGHLTITPGGRYASGTSFSPGGDALVGEQGPEIVRLPGGSEVVPAPMTRARLNAARTVGATNITNIYQNFPAGTRPDDVIRAQRLHQRRNGSGS